MIFASIGKEIFKAVAITALSALSVKVIDLAFEKIKSPSKEEKKKKSKKKTSP